jgi:lupus La protein
MGEKNGVGAPAPAEDIVKQVEYYFGDVNLSRDKFLLGEIAKSDGGWVEMATMLKFNRLQKLAAGQEDVVLDALAAVEDGDGLMEVDKEAKRIRRKPSKPLPADREQFISSLASRTVYVKGFNKDWDLDQVTEFLKPYGPVESVYVSYTTLQHTYLQ